MRVRCELSDPSVGTCCSSRYAGRLSCRAYEHSEASPDQQTSVEALPGFTVSMVRLRTALWSRCVSMRSRLFSGRAGHGTVPPPQNMKTSDFDDFYRHTSGRWLWAEDTRLQERYKRFNVPGLKQLAASASGARSCVDIIKLAEGGFNKVFRLSMDNGAVVIARIPNPNVGPACKVIASEVATMDFVGFDFCLPILDSKLMSLEQVRNVVGIPVPKVLAWDGGTSNSAESEYILMEVATGTQLDEVWTDMDLSDKFKVVDALVAVQQKLQSIAFSRYRRSTSRAEPKADIMNSDAGTSTSNRMLSKVAPRWTCLLTCHIRQRCMRKIASSLGLSPKRHSGRPEMHHRSMIAGLVRSQAEHCWKIVPLINVSRARRTKLSSRHLPERAVEDACDGDRPRFQPQKRHPGLVTGSTVASR